MTYYWQVAPIGRSRRTHRPTDKHKGNGTAGRKKHTHQKWLELIDEKRRNPDWSNDQIEDWLDGNKTLRDEAEAIFVKEQQQLKKREQEESAEREKQAANDDEGGSDQECELCGETEHRPDGDVILLCDNEGCLRASHLGCCDPPLKGVPKGNVSIIF